MSLLPEKFIVVHFNPFDTFSKIDLITKDNSETMYIHSLLQHGVEELVDVCYSTKNYEIFLNAPAEFLPQFRENAKCIENTKYSENKIKIQGAY